MREATTVRRADDMVWSAAIYHIYLAYRVGQRRL
jgi:hypothetical protein